MNISQVIIRKVFEVGTLKAIASIIIDDMFAVHDIKVVTNGEKCFIVMPSKKLPNGEFKDVAHPINNDARSMIDVAVLEAYEKCKELGHGRFFTDTKKTIPDIESTEPAKVTEVSKDAKADDFVESKAIQDGDALMSELEKFIKEN